MQKVILVSCTKNKTPGPDIAEVLYSASSNFRKHLQYVKLLQHNKLTDEFYFILSAKHGLVSPTQKLEYYDYHLGLKNDQEKLEWAKSVLSELTWIYDIELTEFEILATDEYTEHLSKLLPNVKLPFLGMNAEERDAKIDSMILELENKNKNILELEEK